MILSDIKHYLQARGPATLKDLAVHFDADPEAMRGMLQAWIRKGRVSRSLCRTGCRRGCAGCSCDAPLEIYAWRG